MTDTLLFDRVQENMSRLRLSYSSEILVSLLDRSEQMSHLAFIDELLQQEVEQKEQRRIETNLRISGLPFIKSIDEFDFSFQPTLDRQLVMSLFDLTFMKQHKNIVFLGPPGIGKTHLAVALAVKACQAGLSIYSTTMEELIIKLRKDRDAERKGRGRGYHKSALVIIDEVGYTPITREDCNLFFRFIATRYENASTIITSNKAFKDWTEMFHDPIIVTAILDRLLHHSVVINMKGASYRLKEKTESKLHDLKAES